MSVDTVMPTAAKDQLQQRKDKLKELRNNGYCYPNHFRRDQLAADLKSLYGSRSTEELLEKPIISKVAGRIMAKRLMGKASFIQLQDSSGRIQVYVREDELLPGIYEQFLCWDLGDIIGVAGVIFKTKTDELSLRATELVMLTKSLRPLPEKFHGLVDHEIRCRQRYLDLMVNTEARDLFKMRSQIITVIRDFFTVKDFLEVETPMMHAIPGGATARPFITHHNAFDIPLYLRIAPELFLKRLVVGGLEKVFEINRNFRNEGISVRHNPEFTMLEFYQAYVDYQYLMDLTEELLRTVAKRVIGKLQINYQNLMVDLSKPFARMTLQEAIVKFNPELSLSKVEDLEKLRGYAQGLGIMLPADAGLGKIQYELFEKTVEKNLQDPTFITAYPAEVSPLARPNDQNDFIVDRFELFIAGRELANGFSELNDPEEQARVFHKQAQELLRGDDEAMRYDADYIAALEYGLPPTAGEGIGIDRLVMLFANVTSIREVILFPLLRPVAEGL